MQRHRCKNLTECALNGVIMTGSSHCIFCGVCLRALDKHTTFDSYTEHSSDSLEGSFKLRARSLVFTIQEDGFMPPNGSVNHRRRGENREKCGTRVHQSCRKALSHSGGRGGGGRQRSRFRLQAWKDGEDEVSERGILSDEEARRMCVRMLKETT